MSSYETADDGAILMRRTVDPSGVVLVAKAEGIRRERTGAHARVTIGAGESVLAYSVLNIDRDEDRTRLANSAHKALGTGPIAEELPAQQIKRFLDQFARGLWQEHVGRIDVEALEGDPDAATAEYLLSPYLIAGGGTILFAPPKRGKSYTALALAVTADAGITSPFGEAPRPVKVLYVNLERSRESMRARLARVNRALGLDPRRPLKMINRRGSSLADVADRIREAVRDDGIELIILDSLSRSGRGTLLADDVTNAIMDTLNGFVVAWLAIGHTPRGDESHLFGSQMQSAAADMEIVVATERDERSGTLGLALKVVSANDVAYPPIRYLALEFDEQGLTSMRRADSSEFVSLAAETQTVRQQIAEYLALVGKATGQEIADELSLNPVTVRWTLRQYPEFVRLPKEGKAVPYALGADYDHQQPANTLIRADSPTDNQRVPANFESGNDVFEPTHGPTDEGLGGGGVGTTYLYTNKHINRFVKAGPEMPVCSRCSQPMVAYSDTGQPVCGAHFEGVAS